MHADPELDTEMVRDKNSRSGKYHELQAYGMRQVRRLGIQESDVDLLLHEFRREKRA